MPDELAHAQRTLRVFLDDSGSWTELTSGGRPALRVGAPDLRQAQQARSRIRANTALNGQNPDHVSVVIDVTVSVAADFRSARMAFAEPQHPSTVHYAGTMNGLVGLVADIFVAGVADGVTLIPAVAGLEGRTWAQDLVARLSRRLPLAA
jgi:hypothetical protein